MHAHNILLPVPITSIVVGDRSMYGGVPVVNSFSRCGCYLRVMHAHNLLLPVPITSIVVGDRSMYVWGSACCKQLHPLRLLPSGNARILIEIVLRMPITSIVVGDRSMYGGSACCKQLLPLPFLCSIPLSYMSVLDTSIVCSGQKGNGAFVLETAIDIFIFNFHPATAVAFGRRTQRTFIILSSALHTSIVCSGRSGEEGLYLKQLFIFSHG